MFAPDTNGSAGMGFRLDLDRPEVGFLKLYLSTHPVDFNSVAQQTVFKQKSDRLEHYHGCPRLATARAEVWAASCTTVFLKKE